MRGIQSVLVILEEKTASGKTKHAEPLLARSVGETRNCCK